MAAPSNQPMLATWPPTWQPPATNTQVYTCTPWQGSWPPGQFPFWGYGPQGYHPCFYLGQFPPNWYGPPGLQVGNSGLGSSSATPSAPPPHTHLLGCMEAGQMPNYSGQSMTCLILASWVRRYLRRTSPYKIYGSRDMGCVPNRGG
jgi:hypothetical protein